MTLSLFPTVGFYGVSANLNLWGSSEVSAGKFPARSRGGSEKVPGSRTFREWTWLPTYSSPCWGSGSEPIFHEIWEWMKEHRSVWRGMFIFFHTWSWFQKSCCFDSGYSWRSKNIESFLPSELLLISSQIDMNDVHDIYILYIYMYVYNWLIQFLQNDLNMFFINLWMNRDWCCQAADDLGRAACRSIPRTLCSRDHTQSHLAGVMGI